MMDRIILLPQNPVPTMPCAASSRWIASSIAVCEREHWNNNRLLKNGCETLIVLSAQECGSMRCLPHSKHFWQGLSKARTHQRGACVKPFFARRMIWKQEHLVTGRVTKRAMHIIKEIRLLDENEGVELVLDKWVKAMSPVRRDFLDVLQEFGESEEDKELWLKLMEWSLREEWFETNVRDYTKLLKGYGSERRIEDAERLLSNMESIGILPTVVTYTVLIGIYCKQGNVEKAKDVLENINGLGLVPDVKAYNSLLLGYAHGALLKEAKSLLEQMELDGLQPNVDSYIALINGHGRLGEVDQAQRYFDLMQFKGIRPNAKAFTALLDAYGRALEPYAAREVFNNFVKVGFAADDRVLALMLAAYERKDMLEDAINLVVELEKVKFVPGVESWSILIGWFVRIGLIDEAGQIIKDLGKNKHMSFQDCLNIYQLYRKASQVEHTSEISRITN
ncbi:hypothetical protein O6H91_10G094700 [Diphasiastrum complanatum]|uniref:Uncharacterized protein n=5 Tax=Diphasiastrum complanatum TaxID=34168 RepID=A0ACC2CJJ9_DIPCM|nr:hypothetical protein O6H91_10G094700 [Diphasiastrum complanatum]KAJ7542214.1 hypothetical protein O6H91_10G094700 [Diphasiastrum complanatum]KAJ7542215.1 hypothetical protein O6H91_10G094700 [Diphasiastrum complanatum]KAJ7542216.1 hypothetical protein O6H91_10G094700 [Diphasiastrum complanatum]